MLRTWIRDARIAVDNQVPEPREVAGYESPETGQLPASCHRVRRPGERIQKSAALSKRQLPSAGDVETVARLVALLIHEVVLKRLEIVERAAIREAVGLRLLANIYVGNQEVVSFAERLLRFQLHGVIPLRCAENTDLVQAPVLRIGYQQRAERNLLLIPQWTREQSWRQVV